MGGKMSAEYHKQYYHEKRDKKKIFEQKNARRNRLRQQIWEYLKVHPCIVCNENDPIVLDFDHLDPTTKLVDVADTIRRGWAFERILTEIQKCQILCANCHRRKTAKQFGYYRHMVDLPL